MAAMIIEHPGRRTAAAAAAAVAHPRVVVPVVLDCRVFFSRDVVGNGLGETPEEKFVLGVLGQYKLYLGQGQLAPGGSIERGDRERTRHHRLHVTSSGRRRQ